MSLPLALASWTRAGAGAADGAPVGLAAGSPTGAALFLTRARDPACVSNSHRRRLPNSVSPQEGSTPENEELADHIASNCRLTAAQAVALRRLAPAGAAGAALPAPGADELAEAAAAGAEGGGGGDGGGAGAARGRGRDACGVACLRCLRFARCACGRPLRRLARGPRG